MNTILSLAVFCTVWHRCNQPTVLEVLVAADGKCWALLQLLCASTLFDDYVCTGKPLPAQPPAPDTLGVDKSKTPKWEVVVRVHNISLIMEKLPPVGYQSLGAGPDLGTVSLSHHALCIQAVCLIMLLPCEVAAPSCHVGSISGVLQSFFVWKRACAAFV